MQIWQIFIILRQPVAISVVFSIPTKLTNYLFILPLEIKQTYLSGTYCHKTGTRPLSCAKPRQLAIYFDLSLSLSLSSSQVVKFDTIPNLLNI